MTVVRTKRLDRARRIPAARQRVADGRMSAFGIALLMFVLIFVLSGCATSTPSLTTNQLQDMGEKYVAAGDVANALKCLTEAEKKKPESAVIQYDLGLAYNKRGMQNEALAHLQKALKIKPAFPEAWNAIGTVYAERGQLELAQEAFQKAVNDPFYQTPQLPAYNLGRLYEKKGDTTSAAADLEWLRSLGVQVERYALAQQPAAFRDNAAVREALTREGVECLPLFRVDDVTVSKGVYPTRMQLAQWVGLTASAAAQTTCCQCSCGQSTGKC